MKYRNTTRKCVLVHSRFQNSTLKSLYIMKIKGPFVKLIMFDGTFAQVLKVLC